MDLKMRRALETAALPAVACIFAYAAYVGLVVAPPDREMAVRVTVTTVQAVTPPLPSAHWRPLRHRVNSLGSAQSASPGASTSPCR